MPGALDDAMITKLNEKLNSLDDNQRSDAAIDFYKILEKNPGLADNPQYKPYVDAFMDKIMNDPSALVRQAGLLAVETGAVKHASTGTQSKLQELSKGEGLFGVESGAAQNAALRPAATSAA